VANVAREHRSLDKIEFSRVRLGKTLAGRSASYQRTEAADQRKIGRSIPDAGHYDQRLTIPPLQHPHFNSPDNGRFERESFSSARAVSSAAHIRSERQAVQFDSRSRLP
jgi:hypothetical protein